LFSTTAYLRSIILVCQGVHTKSNDAFRDELTVEAVVTSTDNFLVCFRE